MIRYDSSLLVYWHNYNLWIGREQNGPDNLLTNIRYLFPPTRIFRKYYREVFAYISNQIDAINFNTLVPFHLLLFNSVEEWRRGRDQSCPTPTRPSCGHYRNILVAFGRIQLMI